MRSVRAHLLLYFSLKLEPELDPQSVKSTVETKAIIIIATL